jgi:hypothetical protein
MQAQSSPDRRGVVAVGTLLILLGLGAFALQAGGYDLFDAASGDGWPIFVIVPGLVLLTAALVAPVPKGVGFAIAGSIVTTVGLVLFYQQATGHWESWSYAWALVGPGAAGLGMLAYGLVFRQGELVRSGLGLAGIAAVIFVIGFWFFETLYDSGRVPAELDTWWPVALIGVGVAVLIGGMVESNRRHHV